MSSKNIKVLLIEDSKSKANDIMLFLSKNYNDLIFTTLVENVTPAKKNLLEDKFDIIILDLNLPDNDDGPNNFGGNKIVSFCKDEGIDTNKLIFYTSTKKTKDDNEDIIDEKSFFLYNHEDLSWQKCFLKIFDEKLNQFNLKYKLDGKQYDIAIITALNEELEIAKEAISTNWNIFKRTNDSNIYYTTQLKNDEGKQINIIATHSPVMGMANAACVSTKLLLNFKPKMIVMLGICAGREKPIELGHIIVADKVYDYQAGKIEDKKDEKGKIIETIFKPSFDEHPLDKDTLGIITSVKKEYTTQISEDWKKYNPHDPKTYNVPNVHIGPMGSGSAVIAKDEIFNELSEHSRKIIALEMEAYSVFVAASIIDRNVKPLVIKGVQDLAGAKKDDEYRIYSIYTSARFFYYLCINFFIEISNEDN